MLQRFFKVIAGSKIFYRSIVFAILASSYLQAFFNHSKTATVGRRIIV